MAGNPLHTDRRDAPTNSRGPRVAIIGAGPSGIATAFHLTEAQRRGHLPESTEISVYERSWRPGGKGAAGRDPAHGWAITEHGIHLFSGFYRNAFDMVRASYEDLCGADAGLVHLREEFRGNSVTLLRGVEDGRARRWLAPLPRTEGEPWDTQFDLTLDIGLLAEKAADFLADALHTCRILDEPIDVDLSATPHDGSHRGLTRLLGRVRTAALAVNDDLRPVLWGAELFGTMVIGLIADRVAELGIESLDDRNHLTWLAQHGCSRSALESSMTEAIPAICFQFPDGDSRRPASMSASAFVATAARQLLAPGEFAYFFRRGTAESVVLPVVKLLVERGVRFHWCHRLADVTVDATTGRLHSVRFETLTDAPTDLSLVRVPDLDPPNDHDCHCGVGEAWSIHAPTEQDPERTDTRWNGPARRLTAGDDFDAVVLAIPPPAFGPAFVGTPLERLASDLPSVATISVQLWLDRSPTELCLPDLGSDRLAGSDWDDPMNGWVDFTDLLEVERWPDRPEGTDPAGLLYFCGTVITPADQAEAGEVGQRELQRLIASLGALLRGGTPTSIAEHVVHTMVRVNWEGSERYVMSPPHTQLVRPRAWESRIGNLVLAGDWTRNGFDVSSFEASVMSGALASHALCADPPLESVVGYRMLRKDGANDAPPTSWRHPLKPATISANAAVINDASSDT